MGGSMGMMGTGACQLVEGRVSPMGYCGLLFLREPAVMQNMMDGGTMWGMGLGGLIALIILVLVIAALVKYVFFR
jgi:hypothetical protein